MKTVVVDQVSKRYRLGKVRQNPLFPERLQRLLRRGNQAITGRKPPRDIWALQDVSFDVEPGTILGVIGPNGAGKTTLLKVLSRVTLPTRGRAIMRGRVASLLEVGAGFQRDLSALDNIYLHAALYGIPRGFVQERIRQILDFAELGDFVHAPLKQYSSGMYLRLAFSVAINMDPDILLADEVLAVGDINFQERCLKRVEEAGTEGLTVLFVSHDMEAIRRLCTRVVWLNAGQIVEIGDPDTVVSRYEETAWTLTAGRARHGKRGSHACEFGEILSVRLVSEDGREIGAVRVNEDVYLRINFHVNDNRVWVRCAADLFARGVNAFRTLQPDEVRIGEAGIYSARVRIPAHFLNEIPYTVNASVTIRRGTKEAAMVEYNALAFQVYDNDESLSARGNFKGRMTGVVRPRLEWTLEMEREVVSA